MPPRPTISCRRYLPTVEPARASAAITAAGLRSQGRARAGGRGGSGGTFSVDCHSCAHTAAVPTSFVAFASSLTITAAGKIRRGPRAALPDSPPPPRPSPLRWRRGEGGGPGDEDGGGTGVWHGHRRAAEGGLGGGHTQSGQAEGDLPADRRRPPGRGAGDPRRRRPRG